MKIEIKDSEKIFRTLYIVIMLVIVITAVMIILEASAEGNGVVSVGCIFSENISSKETDRQEYESLSAVCGDLGVSLTVRENVKADIDSVFDALKILADDKCRIIFFNDPVHARYAAEASIKYPNISFFVRDAKYVADNVSYYGGREYQVRYLSGIIAGMCTGTKIIGYVAPMASDEVNCGINAFTLGVRTTAPDAVVRVRFTASGYHVSTEYDAVNYLLKENADIIAYHCDHMYVPEACREKGVSFIGHRIGNTSGYPTLIADIGTDMYKIYENAVENGLHLNDRELTPFWLGMTEDAVYLNDISSAVPEKAISAVDNAKHDIGSGIDVFSGTIRDDKGYLRCGEDETMGDRKLLTDMYWFTEGVVIDE